MSWHHIRLDQIAPALWKNGGGTTRELMAWPDAANWVWRMSVAEVIQSGPFSRFEGVQRWFAVLSGAGVRLISDGVCHTLASGSEPLCFGGAAETVCELIDGATQDFNLMTRQPVSNARVLRISKSVNRQLSGLKSVAVYAIHSGATVQLNDEVLVLEPASLAWRSVVDAGSIQIDSASALWIEICDETRERPNP